MAESIKEVFKTMVGIPLSLGAMTAKSSEELVDCVSAVVGMAGSLSVLVDVCCSRKAALQIASALYNEEIQEMNEEVLDAIGELVNMLTGVVSTWT
jgi:chemotaxis protein CheX